jgi:hypothetical protein
LCLEPVFCFKYVIPNGKCLLLGVLSESAMLRGREQSRHGWHEQNTNGWWCMHPTITFFEAVAEEFV